MAALLCCTALAGASPARAQEERCADVPFVHGRAYQSERDAQDVVNLILKYTGLVPQDITAAEGRVKNAMAVVCKDEKGILRRYILYNRDFIARIKTASKTDWSAISIMAHEIGHHLYFHQYSPDPQRKLELQADRFSGFILQKMGARSDQAQAALEHAASDQPSHSHPDKLSRLAAIREGWNEAAALKPLDSPRVMREAWLAVASKETDYAELYNFLAPSALNENSWIKKKWVEGYQITNVAAGDNRWLVFMSRGTGYSTQSYYANSPFPKDFIKKKWSEDYYITSTAYGNGRWFIVMAKGSGFTDQLYRMRKEFPRDWIKQKWGEGYYITNMDYGDGLWLLVMSKGAGYVDQSWIRVDSIPDKDVREKWEKDFEITGGAMGDGHWYVVMSKRSTGRTQAYIVGEKFPNDWIKQQWDSKYRITFIK